MRRNLLALLLALGLASLSGPALAAVCSPTPALPDTERRTEYAGIVAQTGPFNVGFQLYGDGTDFSNWISVWVNGVALTGVTDFTVTSPTGTLATICRPITDAQVTFTVAQTGTIEIEGSRRPRRTSQASETVGITARTFNQVVSDMTAQLRERWDRQSRLVRSPPGEALAVLPPAATRAGKFLIFDNTGNTSLASPTPGLGNVVGPSSSITGHVATWANANGTVLADGGPFRTQLAAPITLYVNENGAPANCNGQTCQVGSALASNTCTTIASPCATRAQAVNLALTVYDAHLNQITIQLSDQTYTTGIGMAANMVGAISGGNAAQAQLIIQGNCSAPANTYINAAAGEAVTLVGVTSPVSFNCLKIGSATTHGMHADFGSKLYYSNIIWGPVAGAALFAGYGSAIEQEGPETISGAMGYHWNADKGSQILLTGQTITCTGAFAAASSFVSITNGSQFSLNGSIFSGCGSITGFKYAADNTSTFGTQTPDPNTIFPGSINGGVNQPSMGLTGIWVGRGGSFTGDTNPVYALGPSNGSIPYWNGTTLANLASIANAALVTDSGGIPVISQTLPTAVQNNISLPNLANTLGVNHGGTGAVTLTGVVTGNGTSPFTALGASNGSLLYWNASALANLGSAANGVLVTDGSGIPSIGSTLPTAVQNNLNINAAWTNFTASPTCGTATFTTNSARFKTDGKTTRISGKVTFTALGTCTNDIFITLPNTPNSPSVLAGFESNLNNVASCIIAAASTSMQCIPHAGNNYGAADSLTFGGVYENQ